MTYDRQTDWIMGLSCKWLMIDREITLTSEDNKMSILNIKDAIKIYILLYIMYNCGMEVININTWTRYLLSVQHTHVCVCVCVCSINC